jgi:hypothetical protein
MPCRELCCWGAEGTPQGDEGATWEAASAAFFAAFFFAFFDTFSFSSKEFVSTTITLLFGGAAP